MNTARGVLTYLVIGTLIASLLDMREMLKPVPYAQFPERLFAMAELWLRLLLMTVVIWLPLIATAIALAVCGRLKAKNHV